MRQTIRDLLQVALIALIVIATAAQAQSTAALNMVFVMDGLRPDSINAADTPTLERLRREGVHFENSHAVFPTVTRVNAISLATGSYPARHGIMGNTIYVPAVNPSRAFTNGEFQMLLRLEEASGGQIVTAPGIAELAHKAGRTVIAVSSGGTGGALLLSPKAHRGLGTVINGYFVPGKVVAFPDAVSEALLGRFGAAPKKGGAKDPYDPAVDWTMQVLRDYVLPELRPQVLIAWITEPDHIQHAFGVGAPQSIASLRNDDRQLGLLLQKLEALGLRDRTNIVVVSDHGFSHTASRVNVGHALVEAGLMPEVESDAVVLASSGQAVALHVKDRNPGAIRAIVEFLQRQPWCGLVFTARARGGAVHEGAVAGTFALEYVHLGGHERSPDIVITFPWSSAPNRHGARGSDSVQGAGVSTGPVEGTGANHGGIGPWTVRNTMLAWGPDFKRGAVVRTPTSNVDVAPTLLHLIGLAGAASGMDGRVLLEALASGPDEEQVALETRTVRVQNDAYRAVLQTSEVHGKRYVDKGWRE